MNIVNYNEEYKLQYVNYNEQSELQWRLEITIANFNQNLLINCKIEMVEEQQKIMLISVKLAVIRPNMFWDFYSLF